MTAGRVAAAARARAVRIEHGQQIRATLLAILAGTSCTSDDLAGQVYLSRFGVLHHLRALEADGLITRDRRTGTPAPRWSLTRKARRP